MIYKWVCVLTKTMPGAYVPSELITRDENKCQIESYKTESTQDQIKKNVKKTLNNKLSECKTNNNEDREKI